ncbi:MAG: hypothetical protein R3E32_01915 [Chitinophagales bacterium]
MEYLEIEIVIKNTVATAIDEKGWANLAKIGILLRQNGVKYANLSKMLQNYGHILEFRKDANFEPPVIYVKIK